MYARAFEGIPGTRKVTFERSAWTSVKRVPSESGRTSPQPQLRREDEQSSHSRNIPRASPEKAMKWRQSARSVARSSQVMANGTHTSSTYYHRNSFGNTEGGGSGFNTARRWSRDAINSPSSRITAFTDHPSLRLATKWRLHLIPCVQD